ncbi:UDP-glucose 4-epimerase GalE [Flaviflexus huanghaiensis]|uniref:UDP-glucose 4-epimerase GalE n=1 Tax=Flaviflexus huanghaiensis TaxID=1111473 RepID=UPI0015FB370F|nr:UDP-glucose 4-epimerase GalE [Flaviflexus huanghaiensis]
MRVLITGGAGYIGSHTAVQLVEAGHDPVIVDSYINSTPGVLARIEKVTGRSVPSYELDLVDEKGTRELFDEVRPDAVIHFAGLKAVGESVEKPYEYYRNNLESALSVVGGMLATGCCNMIFSSSATVYGEGSVPLTEDQPDLSSSNPYGWTKVMIEQILTDIATASNLRVAILRYFNPVGAHPSGLMGEDPTGIPNNLMPYVAQVAGGRREKLTIFGDDYPTEDGTCLRDYLHVLDLADGHIAALEKISGEEISVRAWNLGRGTPVSVLELVHAFEEASGQKVAYEIGPRRAGDLPAVWADTARAREELGWVAERTVEDMCADTWRWQHLNPHGYRTAL